MARARLPGWWNRSWRAPRPIGILLPVFTPESKVAPVARRLAVAALALWLSGVGCLFFGCEMFTASAAHQAEPSAHSHTASPEHGCCHRAKSNKPRGVRLQGGRDDANVQQARAETTEQGVCPLSRQPSTPSRRESLKVAPLVEPAGRPASAAHATTAAAPPNTPALLRVPGRGSTRLRACVFLI